MTYSITYDTIPIRIQLGVKDMRNAQEILEEISKSPAFSDKCIQMFRYFLQNISMATNDGAILSEKLLTRDHVCLFPGMEGTPGPGCTHDACNEDSDMDQFLPLITKPPLPQGRLFFYSNKSACVPVPARRTVVSETS